MSDTRYRDADITDAELLARLNQQLIRDEGHRNAMGLQQLTERMSDWLRGDYSALLFESASQPIGYALFRREPEYVYLRQLYVVPERRRQGVAREAIAWMWRHKWPDAARLRIDVLTGNTTAIAFWGSVGFEDYCLTMETGRPDAD